MTRLSSRTRVFTMLVVAFAISLNLSAAPREVNEPGTVRDVIIRFIKKLPRLTFPHIFDDPVIPKP